MIDVKNLLAYGMAQIRLSDGRRLQIYHDASKIGPVHNHRFKLHSRVLVGSLVEETFDERGDVLGRRYVQEGSEYEIAAETMHRVLVCAVPTVTLVTELEPTSAAVRVLPDGFVHNAETAR